MKKTGMIFLLVITFAFTGCATMEELTGQISAKVTSITSNVDPNLVAKVPEDKRSGFPKAEFAVKVAEEKLKLAQLKTELAAKQKKVTEYEEYLVNIDLKDASLDYDIIKQEAIDATPGLGKKEDSIKALTSLKVKKNDLQSDRIKTNGNIDSTKQQINDMADKIKSQEEKIKELAVDKAKPEEKAAVSTEKEKADKGKGAEAKPEEKAPAAPAEKTK
jgi:chromosome segregation ATPase